MTRILILYASNYGQTCAIANRIAHGLRETGNAVDLLDADRGALPDPKNYDIAVLGSRVQFGRHAVPVLDYIRAHRVTLMEMPTAFFSVSMAAASGTAADPNGYMDTSFAALDWYPTEAIAFGGGIPYQRYNWFLRQVMKRINRNAGRTTDTKRNHVFTDDHAVAAFTDRIDHLVSRPTSAAHV